MLHKILPLGICTEEIFYPHSGIFWESMIARVIPKVSEAVILPDVLL